MDTQLKNLLLSSLITALLGTGFVHADEDALKTIRAAGGFVRSSGTGWEIEFQRKGKEVGDDQLATLAPLGDTVISLNLLGTKTTDEGLKHLAKLKNLQRLHLARTEVGNGGLAHLSGLTKLEYLNLYETKVGDAGLAHLKSLSNLEKLFLWQTDVTGSGCDNLTSALPKVKIFRGVDLDEVAADAKARKEEEKKEEELILRVKLKWNPATTENPPRSVGGGVLSSMAIKNSRSEPVKLYWVEYNGNLKYYAEIAPGMTLTRGTFSKATWLITDLDEAPLGFFTATKEPSEVEVPKS